MKSFMRFTLAVLLFAASAAMCGAQQVATVSVAVEKGDTLLNLFGPDWQKAYDQNRITVIRNGHPVQSPDILVEGMVLQVSADTMLTNRAAARVDGLNQKRAELERRLETLAAKTSMQPGDAATIALCHSKLEAQQFYTADIAFVSEQVTELETADRAEASVSSGGIPWAKTIGLALALLAALAIVAWLFKREKGGTGGLARYEQADAQLGRLLERNAHRLDSSG